MLRAIKVVPIAAESLGVRSMCTHVETPDVRILFDAGVSLCPVRFGLPPHPREFSAIIEARKKIAEAADRVSVVTVSHYHFDHHTPSYEDWLTQWTEHSETARQIYEGKTVFMKNPREQINYSQRRRGWMFQKTAGKHAKKLEIADSRTFVFKRGTKLKFSQPVPHGPEDSFLGWVLMATVEYQDEKFMFAPDVQGPMATRTLRIILKEHPQLLMIGGPPLYLATLKVDEKQIRTGLDSLGKIVETVPTTILDHHLLRDEHWLEKTETVLSRARSSGHTVLTAAEYLKAQNSFLESGRKRLYAEEPPSKEFEKWMHEGAEKQKHVRPPL